MTRAFLVAMLAAVLLILQPAVPQRLGDGAFSAAAWADDDDDDGGSDDDDDDGGGAGHSSRDDDDDDDDGGGGGGSRPSGSSGGGFLDTLFGTQRQPAAPPPAPAPPSAVPDEIVTLALDAADLATLLAQGFTVIEERPLPGVGTVSRRLRIPSDLTLADARTAARALPSGQDADFNHFYRPEQVVEGQDVCPGPDCPDSVLRDWPHGLPRDTVCGPGAPIGMIDTGINADHEAFAGARLEVTRLGRDVLEPSRAIHGTAVAALLVGQPGTRAPGLVPGTRVVAIDAFHRVGGDERADVFSLIEGLDILASEGVSVINLSLAGPPNSVLEEVVERLLSENDILLVASVGNAGPAAEPAYPAAFPPVIAVTAIDREGRVYRRAVRGAHVDLAAPGVEVWTAASVSGARWKTGTSFAVPFVSAAAALLRAERPDLGAPQVAEELLLRALDLGDPGRDDVFGAGLVDLDALCGGPL
ncbi:MAG: subtilase family serine protease [Rhodobacteraceae bacterium HLUCCO18]|nr:MAG: subtilase family serine protease [Rhodobacteraceae bacterium HLUCCO18]